MTRQNSHSVRAFFNSVIAAVCVSLALIGLPATAAPAQKAGATQQVTQSININKADAATLAAGLNGIGPSKAEAIVSFRKQHGPFKNVEQLLDVKGIGPATLKKNRSLITL